MKIIRTVFLSVILCLAMVLPVSVSANAGSTFYLVPHQDDELLTFGVSILRHLEVGHDVHLVLMTDGQSSAAIKSVNKKLKKNLTKKEFSAARTKEFKASAKALGVPEKNLHFYNYVDGKLKVGDVKKMVKEIQKKYLKARFKTMSYYDAHADHANAGKALQEMYNNGEVKDVRFYLKSSQFKSKYKMITYDKYNKAFKPKLVAGVKSYNTWNPSKGYYAIGYTSVPGSMKYLLSTPESKYHKPNYKLKQ
ncbi:PIG-L family deacetylase [Oceanobacillus chungangensis]|uniref:PIG-L family deacetylase n=1 Tax=Oceanobacillus chungangensis TaxID=1229152 RepID=A0A3D8PWP3_9BACI|nr:PIG-L family deacetylase [Oceanobacillus chungangensis]RDW19731.1 hypothetical protein CWR45_06545 [Oceanobacillus chungangensis]